MKPLSVQAFGKLQLQVGNHTVASFPTRHVEELLGYFLLNQQARHYREKLIGILWPYSEPDKARGRFSTALWRLRTLFGNLGLPAESYLHATREWVAFVPNPPPQLDIERFARKVAQAEAAADDVIREDALRAAIATYRGDLYEGIYSDWCLLERERLARARLRAIGQLMACCVKKQAYEEALDWGQTILQEDPLREEVHRAMMHCYWRLGQRPQAVRQFHQCAQGLMDELRILPMPETIAIYQQIVADRLKQAQNKKLSRAQEVQLRQAFSRYQQAADELNAFLDEAE